MSDSLIIIPTYNEIENVESMARKVMSYDKDFHILFVDDNSPDGTAAKIMELQNEFQDRIYLESRKGKLGLGTAYIHGFKWALAKGYEFIFEMDCDFSHNPDDYQAGDLVTVTLPANLPHIMVVSEKHDLITKTPLVIHNIGAGTQEENRLFEFPMTGHYRIPHSKN